MNTLSISDPDPDDYNAALDFRYAQREKLVPVAV